MKTKAKIRTRKGTQEVRISGVTYTCDRWQRGRRLPGSIIALDTETTVATEHEIPDMAVATASDGQEHVLIHPDDIGEFLRTHPDVEFVCHNAAFDFWVLHQHLTTRNETESLKIWKQVVVDKRLHDTMLLDILLRLSVGEELKMTRGKKPYGERSLEDVVHVFTGMEISKDDPYRMRFGEILGRDWDLVEPGFFSYAIKDSIVTLLVYRVMQDLATEVMEEHGYDPGKTKNFDIYSDAVVRFGPLSEAIQVEGAIALAQVSRNGMHTDPQRLQVARQEYWRRFQPLIQEFHTLHPGILRFDDAGQPELTKTGIVQKSNTRLDAYLLQAAADISRQTGTEVSVPRAKKGGVSRSVESWKHLIPQHAFLTFWERYETMAKLNQFFEKLNQPILHPNYRVLIRTGRTSCSSPNMQQVPREDTFRQIIVPSPGHLLLAVDYSYIELVTLAAVCSARFGSSKLGDVIRKGIDPHCHTAAMLAGVTFKTFMRWKTTDPDRFKRLRQQAKPVNFGVPGGMGPEALVDYARNAFGVETTLGQAQQFHKRLTEEIYPELGLYLADTSFSELAGKLHAPESVCRERLCFGDMTPSAAATTVRKIVIGKPLKKGGIPYSPAFVCRRWDELIRLNQNSELAVDLQRRVASTSLANKLFDSAAITLSGRIRGNTTYTQQRNTPFQSLASDGAKMALWRLTLADYRVVGFVHDEILVELPDLGGYADRAIVEDVVRIMKESMEELTGDVPVNCEYALGECWSKNAKAIVDGDRVLAWRPEEQGGLRPV